MTLNVGGEMQKFQCPRPGHLDLGSRPGIDIFLYSTKIFIMNQNNLVWSGKDSFFKNQIVPKEEK